MMLYNISFVLLANYCIFGKFQQQLFCAGIPKCDGRFGVLARALNLYDVANAKALMLNDIAYL